MGYIKNEKWKDIEGYNGDYQISSFGRIKSFKHGNERRYSGSDWGTLVAHNSVI